MSPGMALAAYLAVCAASAVLWLFGPAVRGWAP